jgi:hypothetical protein
LANDLQLYDLPKPRGAGEQTVIFGEPRPEVSMERALSLLVR